MTSNFASLIDHTLLKPCTTLEEVEQLCNEAVKNNCATVCVLPLFVKKAKELTKDSLVKVGTVIGFPHGYNIIEAKLAEIIMAIVDGADELDVAINITALKNADWQYLAKEINTILPVIKNKGKAVKVVVESCLLSEAELIKCCDIYGLAGVDYFALSTGMETDQPIIETIELVRKHLEDKVGIKLSVNIAGNEEIISFTKAGVNRIGCRHFI